MRLPELLDQLSFAFTTEDVAQRLGLKKSSALKLCQRYVGREIFLRLKRDCYILKRNFNHLTHDQALRLSGKIQDNTSVSCTTALQYHQIFSGQSYLIESIGGQRSFERRFGFWTFRFYKLPRRLLVSIPIVGPEKALLDLFYLRSLGRYPAFMHRIRRDLLSRKKMEELAQEYPLRVQKCVNRLWKSTVGVAPVPGRVRNALRRGV